MNGASWNTLLHLCPDDFKHPSKVSFSIVQATDLFAGKVGGKPLILSDWRPFDSDNPTSRHFNPADAVDTTWPGQDPLRVLRLAKESQLFGGIGVYVNPLGIVSFHFDRRPPKADGSIATWGGVITHPLDPTTGQHLRRTEYVAQAVVLEILKKKEVGAVLFLIVSGYLLWRFTSPQQ